MKTAQYPPPALKSVRRIVFENVRKYAGVKIIVKNHHTYFGSSPRKRPTLETCFFFFSLLIAFYPSTEVRRRRISPSFPRSAYGVTINVLNARSCRNIVFVLAHDSPGINSKRDTSYRYFPSGCGLRRVCVFHTRVFMTYELQFFIFFLSILYRCRTTRNVRAPFATRTAFLGFSVFIL